MRDRHLFDGFTVCWPLYQLEERVQFEAAGLQKNKVEYEIN